MQTELRNHGFNEILNNAVYTNIMICTYTSHFKIFRRKQNWENFEQFDFVFQQQKFIKKCCYRQNFFLVGIVI